MFDQVVRSSEPAYRRTPRPVLAVRLQDGPGQRREEARLRLRHPLLVAVQPAERARPARVRSVFRDNRPRAVAPPASQGHRETGTRKSQGQQNLAKQRGAVREAGLERGQASIPVSAGRGVEIDHRPPKRRHGERRTSSNSFPTCTRDLSRQNTNTRPRCSRGSLKRPKATVR